MDKETFGDLSYKYCGRHITDVEYGNFFDCYELLLADIVEVILNDEQEQLFRDLMENLISDICLLHLAKLKQVG